MDHNSSLMTANVGEHPAALAYDRGRSDVYSVNAGFNTLVALDATTGVPFGTLCRSASSRGRWSWPSTPAACSSATGPRTP